MDALTKAIAYAKGGDKVEAGDIEATLTAANMALAYAAIAQAESAQRQAAALEKIAAAAAYWLERETPHVDPRIPGESWLEYHTRRGERVE